MSINAVPLDHFENIEHLLRAAQSGERAALDEVVRRFYEPVRSEVHRRLAMQFGARHKNGFAAVFSTGDIVHEVFLRVLQRPLRLTQLTEENLVAYLVITVQNFILDTVRFHFADRRDLRRRLVARGDLPDPVEGSPAGDATPSRAAAAREDVDIYATVLASFPARERELLRRRFEDRTSFDELAVQLGYKSGDVSRKAFHAAKAKLLVRLRAQGLDASGGPR